MAKPPINKAARKPTGKKTFSLDNLKEKIGIVNKQDKPLEWIELSPAFQEATGQKGYPKGYVSYARGHSNTGKSTALCEAIVAAQKMGILPIIMDAETNLGYHRLKQMGFDWESGFYIKVDGNFLLENFAAKKDKDRKLPSIEDMAECMNYFLNLQQMGELPYDLLFAIDSIGTYDCNRTINAMENSTSDNNQWNAGAYAKHWSPVLDYRVPNSRSVDSEFTNTVIAVAKIWLQNNQVGPPTVKQRGGDANVFSGRFVTHHGGQISASAKLIKATCKGKEIVFGVETKVSLVKNHIDGETGGISMSGSLISTPHGFIGTSTAAKNQYKKEKIDYFRSVLGGELSPDDIKTVYEEGTDFELEDLETKLQDIQNSSLNHDTNEETSEE